MAKDWVTVFDTTEQVECLLIKGLLEASGLIVRVQAEGLKALPAFFGHGASGLLKVQVVPEHEELARAILAAEPEMPAE